LQLYSKNWQTRAKAFGDLSTGLKKFNFEKIERQLLQETFIALFSAINFGIADKDRSVNIEAISLFITVIDESFKNLSKLDSKIHKTEFGLFITSIIDNLLMKMTDSNPELKGKSSESLAKSSFFPLMGPSV
jgi:hypothetical protein